jgi:hypothetical protein
MSDGMAGIRKSTGTNRHRFLGDDQEGHYTYHNKWEVSPARLIYRPVLYDVDCSLLYAAAAATTATAALFSVIKNNRPLTTARGLAATFRAR